MKYICSVCGYVYDEDKGIPEKGIPAGTKFESLPEDFSCPWCSAPKSAFESEKKPDVQPEVKVQSDESKTLKDSVKTEVITDSDFMNASVICSNLARGMEKQYKKEEAEAFTRIAEYLKAISEKRKGDISDISDLNADDLTAKFPEIFSVAKDDADRGALRALTWSEKVSKMLKSVIMQYKREGQAMLEHKNVYVCSICGFVYIGNELPEVCPVCKVPNKKFIKIQED